MGLSHELSSSNRGLFTTLSLGGGGGIGGCCEEGGAAEAPEITGGGDRWLQYCPVA